MISERKATRSTDLHDVMLYVHCRPLDQQGRMPERRERENANRAREGPHFQNADCACNFMYAISHPEAAKGFKRCERLNLVNKLIDGDFRDLVAGVPFAVLGW